MTLPEVLGHFHGVRRVRNGYMALCPAHPDKNQSLSITERNGKILLYCHAGCSLASILSAAKIKKHEFLADARPEPQIVATHDYTEEKGQLLFQVVRYEPKSFRQRRPDGRGGWLWSLNGARRVIYRLPEVLKAESVLILEGEKDCEAARRLGLVGTCNPGGAGKWREGYSESLRGKRVAIICDADPTGLEHGWKVARSLAGIAASVRLVKQLPDAKDLSEWVDRGGTRDGLLRIIRETPGLGPADLERRDATAIPVPGVLASDVKPEKVRWLWEGHIPLGKVSLFDGDPDEGKSLVSIDLAARLTCGSKMPDGSGPAIPPAGAVLVSLEDGVADTIRPRLEAAGADLCRVRIVPTITGADRTERTPTLPDDLPAIEAAIRDVGARLIVLDPLVAMLAGETNSYRDQDIRRLLAPLAALAERTGVAVVCIRHLNKGGGQNAKYRGGGSIGIIGAARASFLFADDPDDEGSRVMAAVKGNLWRSKPESLRYRIEDRDGQPLVSWNGTSSHTAKSLLAQPESPEESNACASAREFLLEALANGPMDSSKVKGEAVKAGHSEKTLFRAKHQLRVKAQKVGFGDGQHWEWALPEGGQPPTKMVSNGNLATFEEAPETKPVISNSSPKMANRENMTIFEPPAGHLRGGPLDSTGPDALEF